MLPAGARLRHKAEFRQVIRTGCRAGSPLLSGYLLVRSGSAEAARVGFVVNGKVGSSVIRHKVLRRLRHLARGYLESLPGGSLLVLRAHPRAATACQADLAAELDLVLSTLLRRQGEKACQ
jgi:ribonuclease P protein component